MTSENRRYLERIKIQDDCHKLKVLERQIVRRMYGRWSVKNNKQCKDREFVGKLILMNFVKTSRLKLPGHVARMGYD